MPHTATRTALLLALTGVLAAPGSARAGSYTISSACADWELVQAVEVAATGEGCNLFLRNSGSGSPAGGGDASRWLYNAPPGTTIADAGIIADLAGGSGWQATAFLASPDGSFQTLAECPSSCGPALSIHGYRYGATQFGLQVRCGASTCPRDQIYGRLSAAPRSARIVIYDDSRPAVALTGGSLLSGWRRGKATVSYDASDNVGIRQAAPVVDFTSLENTPRVCDETRKIPCPNGGGTFELDTERFGDGEHRVGVRVVDSAGNIAGSVPESVLIDNTPPAAPIGLTVAGGETWRRENRFDVAWTSPKQTAAPIEALVFQLCPEATPREKPDGCSEARAVTKLEPVDKADPAKGTRVTGITVPDPGAYQARFSLRDAAGNADLDTAVVQTLRFDPDPPQLAFVEQDPADPARLRVRASDATSGVTRGEIEVRRDGEEQWRPLAVEPTADGFRAFMDDALLPRGVYALRARAFDGAANEASTTSRATGEPAQLKIPVRLRSRLSVGARGARRCRGHGRRRSCRYKLRGLVSVRYLGAKRLYGRLMVGREPVRDAEIEVWAQPKLPGAPLERVDTVRTSRSGRFSIQARKGPARLLRFRYAGTNGVRSDVANVRMAVRGLTTFRPSRRLVVNGEYVTFRGRVRGRPLPPRGKLVELQVFSRRRWRTFAQPRTDAAGRWEYRYRFELIRGRPTLRFRARIRTEAGYPFETGRSEVARVRVRGL